MTAFHPAQCRGRKRSGMIRSRDASTASVRENPKILSAPPFQDCTSPDASQTTTPSGDESRMRYGKSGGNAVNEVALGRQVRCLNPGLHRVLQRTASQGLFLQRGLGVLRTLFDESCRGVTE